MLVLGIDTATPIGSIGLIEDDMVIAEYVLNVVETHSARLMPALDDMLRRASVDRSEIDAIAVTRGPGSFTGVRVGVATAKGLAFALKKPIIGVISLDVLAFNLRFHGGIICPMLDARKKQVFTAFYQDSNGKIRRISDYKSISPEILLKSIRRKTIFAGTGVDIYKSLILSKLKERAIFPPLPLHRIHPEVIGTLALEALEKKEETDPITLVPFYIRPSDAELS